MKPASTLVKKEKKEGHKKKKVDKEELKPLCKVSKGKAVTVAESTKTSKLTLKKRDAVVLLDNDDDEDDRPYRKCLISQNNMRPPLPAKLMRSPKKKEDDGLTFSDYSKQSDDGTFSGSDDNDVFGSEEVKEDSTVCSFFYVMLFVNCFKHF